MADDPNETKPGHATRFKKGRSGNPKGRPRKGKPVIASSYDALFDFSLPARMDGIEQNISAEQALQIKTYNLAAAGNRPAQRKIGKMIAEREAYFASKIDRSLKVEREIHGHHPTNAFAALLLLGIASHVHRGELDPEPEPGEDPRYLLLEPWAVQLAIDKRKFRQPHSRSRPLPTSPSHWRCSCWRRCCS